MRIWEKIEGCERGLEAAAVYCQLCNNRWMWVTLAVLPVCHYPFLLWSRTAWRAARSSIPPAGPHPTASACSHFHSKTASFGRVRTTSAATCPCRRSSCTGTRSAYSPVSPCRPGREAGFLWYESPSASSSPCQRCCSMPELRLRTTTHGRGSRGKRSVVWITALSLSVTLLSHYTNSTCSATVITELHIHTSSQWDRTPACVLINIHYILHIQCPVHELMSLLVHLRLLSCFYVRANTAANTKYLFCAGVCGLARAAKVKCKLTVRLVRIDIYTRCENCIHAVQAYITYIDLQLAQFKPISTHSPKPLISPPTPVCNTCSLVCAHSPPPHGCAELLACADGGGSIQLSCKVSDAELSTHRWANTHIYMYIFINIYRQLLQTPTRRRMCASSTFTSIKLVVNLEQGCEDTGMISEKVSCRRSLHGLRGWGGKSLFPTPDLALSTSSRKTLARFYWAAHAAAIWLSRGTGRARGVQHWIIRR